MNHVRNGVLGVLSCSGSEHLWPVGAIYLQYLILIDVDEVHNEDLSILISWLFLTSSAWPHSLLAIPHSLWTRCGLIVMIQTIMRPILVFAHYQVYYILKSCSIKGGGGGLKKSSHCHTVALLTPFFEEFDIHDLRVRYVWFSLDYGCRIFFFKHYSVCQRLNFFHVGSKFNFMN